MTVLTFATALATPLPPKRFSSPSRSSTASNSPVEAPLGAIPLPTVPSDRTTSASTVGLPRESRISLPVTCSMDACFNIVLRASFNCCPRTAIRKAAGQWAAICPVPLRPSFGRQAISSFRSSSTVPIPAMPKFFTSTPATLGDRKAGSVGPR